MVINISRQTTMTDAPNSRGQAPIGAASSPEQLTTFSTFIFYSGEKTFVIDKFPP